MVRYLIEGGIWYMGTLTLLFLIILSISAAALTLAITKANSHSAQILKYSGYIKSIALFTLVFGIFGQIMGLMDIFTYLARVNGEISPSALITAIRLTCYTTLYGILIYLLSILISLGLTLRLNTLKSN